MGMRAEEEGDLPGTIRKKYTENENNEANACKEPGDCRDIGPSGVEGSFKLNEEGKKRKKDKKNHEFCSNVQLDGILDEGVNLEDCAEVENTHRQEKDQKKKKKKKKNKLNSDIIHIGMRVEEEAVLPRKMEKNSEKNKKNEANASEEAGGYRDEVPSRLEDSFRLSKEDKKKKMDKKKYEVRSNVQLDGICDEAVQSKNCAEVDKTHQEEKDQKKKKKKKKRKLEAVEDRDVSANVTRMEGEEKRIVQINEGNAHSTRNKTLNRKAKNGNKGKRKKPDSVENNSEDCKSEGKSKKVRFSDHIEVFPSSDDPSTGKEKNPEEDLVRGKRFSREEDEIIKEAVYNYIKVNCLGDEGLKMVLHCRSYSKVRNCWKEIGAVLPHRPYQSIYYRAHTLFERDERRAWTPEEYELVRKFHEKHGSDWKQLSHELGKHRVHVKDAWRRIKLPNTKKGNWSQEEYQNLFDLVNMDLRMKAFEEKKSKHGMLRDNICWGAISDKLSTRTDAICCMKWYNQLTSSMVAEDEWADADDYRLLISLFSLDACCVEDVDWDNLIDHRAGDVCRKRWNQMVLHLGQHGNKSFAEQVEVLSKRYCPDLLEAREIWDSKPIVP